MGWQQSYLSGGAQVKKRYKLNASVSNIGVPIIHGAAASGANAGPATTTDAGDAIGLGVDTGTYSATQGDAEGTVSVDIRPDLVIGMFASGGATEGTALTTISNTAAETAGTTITDADFGSNDMDGGIVWCTKGANVGQSRTITTFNSATSVVVTVPFLNDIASGDEFLFVPWNMAGDGAASGGDGPGNVQLTTNLYQADASIASGTGIVVVVVDLVLKGTTDTQVHFVLRDHALNVDTI